MYTYNYFLMLAFHHLMLWERKRANEIYACFLGTRKLQIVHFSHSTGTENSGLLMSFCHKKL